MFSIDLVTFFYKYPNCITVTTYQKSEPARTFENENCVCVRDHDDVWFIEKNDVKRTRWWTNMDTTSKIKSKKYYLLCFYVLFQMLFLSKRKKYLRYRYVLNEIECERIFMALNMARLHDMLYSLITLWKSEYNS